MQDWAELFTKSAASAADQEARRESNRTKLSRKLESLPYSQCRLIGQKGEIRSVAYADEGLVLTGVLPHPVRSR